MRYEIIDHPVPKSKREEYNKKILYAIDQGKDEIPRETVFNCYTGLGGLHGLKQADFGNYNDYAQAKKEYEMGQFFTPHALCRRIVEMAAPEPTESVLDMCCGMGNFFNALPNICNASGFDIDPDAVKVARYLYPEADIQLKDIRSYDAIERYDMILGNPPYNLEHERMASQFYYFQKAYEQLNPAGLLVVIVPNTFMQSEFWDKSQVRTVERRFSFIGQARLPSDAFAALGVEDFATKVMVFARQSEHIESSAYRDDEFITMEYLHERVMAFRVVRQNLKLKLRREANHLLYDEDVEFQRKIDKYLYELKTHPHLRDKHDKAVALVTKFRNQKPPEEINYAKYLEYKKNRLTYAMVLSIIRRYIRRQYDVPRKEVALVKTSYSYKLKAYAPHLLDDVKKREVPIYQLALDDGGLPAPVKNMAPDAAAQYAAAMRVIRRKHREYLRNNVPILDVGLNPELAEHIAGLRFLNNYMEVCQFNDLQQHDMNLIFQRRYSLLNWQQGSGKTAVAYFYGKYLREKGRIRNSLVLAPAIAIEMTWVPFLQKHKKRYVHLTCEADFAKIRPGMFILVSLTLTEKLSWMLKGFMRLISRKVCLIFDESDEITNDKAQRTRRALDLFRRAKYKLLATGTSTRNNVAELYGQYELLYNNSVNLMCWCKNIYTEDRYTREITRQQNLDYGKPFPPRYGAQLFKNCFCPGKATVFGIEKRNQDIYNKDELARLNRKTILTRKFKEFAKDKYEVVHHSVEPGSGEKAVYATILKEFCRICYLYFNSTGDARKEASLRLVRQIMLMIRACSIPNKIVGYKGEPFPRKARCIADLIRSMSGKVAVGCTTIEAMEMYADYLAFMFPNRPLFVIHGEITFKRRQKIIKEFEATDNGILVCTQQSLKSSTNIPSCDEVILESLQWNIPRMEQFYFRFIRLDSKNKTRVHYVCYKESIEQNIIALVLTKERLNEFVKVGEIMEESEIFDEFDVSSNLIENLLKREQDKDGNFYIAWGNQRVA